MNIINLSEDFNPFEGEEGNIIPTSIITFSGGEPHVKIDVSKGLSGSDLGGTEVPVIAITARLHTSEEVLRLGLLVDAISRLGVFPEPKLLLFTPYFPGARQDRVMNPGEALSVKFYADYINRLGFISVSIFDPHSDVVGALVNNLTITNNHAFINKVVGEINKTKDSVEYFVSPDAGSDKKVNSLVKSFGKGIEVIRCGKNRDVKTGKISDFVVYADDLKGASCLIVDDICDGGGTFLGLAKELKKKGAGKLYLAVSHGIFSKGLKELSREFETVFTTDSFPSVDDPWFSIKNDNYTHCVHQIKLSECYI